MTGVAPDGSPVELYLRLPSFGEAEIIDAAIPTGAEILELGCGTGRMTHELIRLGHPVTAVDEAPEMLVHVRGATKVQCRVEELDLDRRFDAIVMASHLVNAADPRERRRLLEVCARHVQPAGRVIVEAYPEDWRPQVGVSAGRGDLAVTFLQADWDGPIVTATVEYRIGDQRWTQGPFTAEVLDEAGIAASVAGAGLAFDGWLDERRTWFAARPAA
jgi:SAM-dependent methyltransferase